MDIKELDKKYIANTYRRSPLFAKRGHGAAVFDEDGREYLDMGSGIAVNTFGLCDSQWIDAVTEQINSLAHLSNLYYTEPQIKLAEMLCQKTGMERVFFGNSGAEANECAIKCARKYSSDKYGDSRYKIVTLVNSFHGRTLATLSATGQEAMHVHFGPFLEGFVNVPANDFDALEAACRDDVCAVMMELIQGEGGVNVLDKGYVAAAARLCAEKDILLIIDEVQTGNGRTGSLYAYNQFGIKPDIVTTAKGLGGELPLGSCMLGSKVKDTLGPGTHGSTFGGNPVCCAGALSILSRLDDGLFAEVTRKGEKLKELLLDIPGVKSVSGLGLMLGLELEKSAAETAAKCLEQGLIVLTAHEKLRLLPPLNITDEQLEKAAEILKGVLEK